MEAASELHSWDLFLASAAIYYNNPACCTRPWPGNLFDNQLVWKTLWIEFQWILYMVVFIWVVVWMTNLRALGVWHLDLLLLAVLFGHLLAVLLGSLLGDLVLKVWESFKHPLHNFTCWQFCLGTWEHFGALGAP